MQKDLVTSIGTALVVAVIAFFVCNLFLGPIEDVSFKTIDSKVSTEIADPDPEVFNYNALNPTVEVYVGDCQQYNDYGECVDEKAAQEMENAAEENYPTNTPENQ